MSVNPSPGVRNVGTVIRRKRRRWITKAQAARLLTRGLVISVALVLGCSVMLKVLRPFRLVHNEKRAKAEVVSNYLNLKKQNQQLNRQLHYLQTPEGIAQEARKQGFVKPGEVSLVIPEEKPSKQ